MRTALILLFLLALGAIPGSVIPQEAVDSLRASQWREAHPKLTPVYEKLGLFSVYNSVWFSAIYILLMLSLVGCIVPRLLVYWRGVRRQPPKAPRNLGRLAGPPQLRDRRGARRRARAGAGRPAEAALPAWSTDDSAVSAERGYLREAGNLLFHLSVLVVLVGFAVGGLFGFKGGVIVVTKDGFANTLSQYDDFRAGSLFDPAELDPFEFTVNDFDVTFIREGREEGMAHKFAADLTYKTSPGATERDKTISVNHPLSIKGTDVFLISHGYAPHITVRNADGTTAFSGPVVFLPEDSSFRSFGVVKVPDASQENGSRQLGLEGEFYPTYAFTKASGPFSAFPDDRNPAISMLAWSGDLGLDQGTPQSVYALQKKGLEAGAEGRRQADADRPRRRRLGPAARRPGHRHARRGQPLREAPGQPHAGPADRAERGRPRTGRAARLAVHPPAPDVGAGASGGRAYARRGRRTRPQRRWGPDRRDRDLHRFAPAGAHRPDPRRRVVVTHSQFELLSNQAVAACAVVYFLAVLAHLAQWALARKVEVPVEEVVSVGAGAGADVAEAPAAAEVDESEREALFGRIGVALTVVAAFVQFIAIVARGLAADPVRVPWGNMYEFTLVGTWVVVVGYLLLYKRYQLSWLSPIVTGFVLVTLMIDVLVLYTPVVPLRDALQSPWLVIHVVAAIIATGAFTLGGMCSAMFLVKQRWEEKQARREQPVDARLPGPPAQARRPRPRRLPGARVRLPDLDLRGADRRADLGALRLGSLLGLGPQGGVGLHHLGGVRRLPARPRHVGLEGPLGRHRRARRTGHAVVQLRRDQLLLRQREPALLRRSRADRGRPDALAARPCPCCAGACARARAGSPRRRRGPPGHAGRAWGRRRRSRRGCVAR